MNGCYADFALGRQCPQLADRTACVVLRPAATALSLCEVAAFMEARHVMRQKIPEQLEIVAELPRNATGKVRKDVLRARFRTS